MTAKLRFKTNLEEQQIPWTTPTIGYLHARHFQCDLFLLKLRRNSELWSSLGPDWATVIQKS